MTRIYILPCSATKAAALRNGPLPARLAYAGQAFRMLRRRLDAACAPWLVLSARHGFIAPDAMIEHYDQRMQRDETPRMDRLAPVWRGHLRDAAHVIVLGSALYARACQRALDCEFGAHAHIVHAPLAGLPIGRMLAKIATINIGEGDATHD